MKKLLLLALFIAVGALNVNADVELYLHNQNSDWSAYPAFTNSGTNENGEVVWVYTLTSDYIGSGDFYFRLKFSNYNDDLGPYDHKDYTMLTSTIDDGFYESYEINHSGPHWGNNGAFCIPHSTIKAAEYTITVYAKQGTKYYLKVEVSKMPITVSSAGYSTFSCNYAVDLSTLSNVKAYTASNIEDGKVIMTKQANKVPANTGLFIQSTEGTAVNTTVSVVGNSAASSWSDTNLLKAANGEEVAASGNGTYHYVFANQNDELGFYNLASALTIPAGKAYLETTTALTTNDNAKVALSFEGEATGINEVNAVENNDWYTINGIRVAVPTKGLYIHNGKKVMVK